MRTWCCDERRRELVRPGPFNGIEFLDVVDQDALANADRQRFLRVTFVNSLQLGGLNADNLRIEGGERIRNVQVLDVVQGLGDDADVLTVEVDQPGDFSVYTLRLVISPDDAQPPEGFDPRLSAVAFSFKVECPSDFDCGSPSACVPEAAAPELDYRAKDYERFRRLMLERLSLRVPGWTERSPADLGITLVEMLAYVADQLSYRQDAIATEAYLDTARRRVSVKRHARLVDYHMHDGANARTWVHVEVAEDVPEPVGGPALARGTVFCTRLPQVTDRTLATLPAAPDAIVFEAVHDLPALWTAHNELPFYTWSDRECCLPRTATQATLHGHFPNLRVGEVLIVEEALGPKTGNPADADPAHRHALRLTSVQAVRRLADDSLQPLSDPVTGEPVTEIGWHAEDALPFALCLSATVRDGDNTQYLDRVSVARGNIVLADHGRSLATEALGYVPEPVLFHPSQAHAGCVPTQPVPVPARFRPTLAMPGLSFAGPYQTEQPASRSLVVDPRTALPSLTLTSQLGAAAPEIWIARADLLTSRAADRHVVVEVDNGGSTQLRFGDDRYGLRPQSGERFEAAYRVGNGSAGNIGADSLYHLVADVPGVTRVRNPLPAAGGVNGETIEQVRRRAPQAFRTQERAVTEADYGRIAERHPALQRATATSRWTGSWHTLFITADRSGGAEVDEAFETQLVEHIEPFRMAGHDLEIDGPRYVSLEIELQVCAKPDYARQDVKRALLSVLHAGVGRNGELGLFHPDRFSFGEPVYLGPLLAAAQAIDGVASVQATCFQRLGQPQSSALVDGVLELDRLEVARLGNDPNFVEHGVLRLDLGGGR